MNSAAVFERRLQDLKQRFVQTMPDRIEAIASTLSGCSGTDRTSVLERQFHSLAGVAGTYQLNAIAAVAAEGEEACAELHESVVESGDLTYLEFLVGQLRGALAVDHAA